MVSLQIRQGDPLSPYLFLLCAEGFSTLLNAAESSGALEGVSICRDAPSITHLLFTDDSLLLLKVNDESAHHLWQVLQLYENFSGQIINKDKSSIMFSTNTKMVQRGRFMEILDIPREARSDKYLGLPVYIGCSKTKVFEHLKERVWKRIQGWKERLLSRAGKETLIKSIAQAIPTYAMSCFDITKSLCNDISTMINRFWWAQQDWENKIYWLSMDTLCSRKEKGGLGYRDLHLFNLAMLARQAWRMVMNPNSLCARLLTARYCPEGSIMEAKEGPGISYSWQSILRGVQALKEGIIWRVGDGESIRIWEDPWIPRGMTRRPITPRGAVILSKVSKLIDPLTGSWDNVLLEDIFLGGRCESHPSYTC